MAFTKESPREARDWRLLATVSFLISFGFAIYQGIFSNFISERLGVVPKQLGVLESLREVPGLLTAFTASMLVSVAEPRLAVGALALSAAGIAATGQAPSFAVLAAFSMTWSVGMHLWFALQPSLTMSLAGRNAEGRGLGRMARYSAMATLLALALVAWIGTRIDYPAWFLVAGAVMLAGSAVCRRMSPELGSQSRPRLTFHRRFGLYYVLTMLEGCRRQIFTTFATYALVREYHTPVQVISTLMLVNNSLSLVAAPVVGSWVDRLGERRMLTIYYVAMALVFSGYATVHHPYGLYALYCLDSLFFTFSVGLTIYLRRIAGSGELTSSLMMGLTFNHVAAVIVPIAGGLMWQYWGYERTFWAGAGIVTLSLALCRRIPARKEGDG